MNKPESLTAEMAFATRFSAREFESMLHAGAFSDMRVELASGVFEKMMPSLLAHGECNVKLAVRLMEAFAGRNLRIAGDLAVRIDDATVRAPDIAVGDFDTPSDRIPDARHMLMVVEIADATLARDLGPKAEDYARASIATYWVVDLSGRVVHCMTRPTAKGYADRVVLRFGEPIPVPGTDRTITID